MPRKKKTENIDVSSKPKEKTNKEEFVYCGLRKCPNTICLRHNVNTQFNVVIHRRNFNPDKDWNCKDMEV